ncbi:MAG: STAS-like domain-containing protein [Rickettsiales bacterium]|nr:STAS-like domain-containing protein [Rickettsiales bacterium]
MPKRDNKIARFIIDNVRSHPTDIARFAADNFNISIQAINRYLRNLVSESVLVAEGKTKSRKYSLFVSINYYAYDINEFLQEHRVWNSDIDQHLNKLPENVHKAWNYCFSEIFNNAIDHSGGSKVYVIIKQNILDTEIIIQDDGIGIFKKIGDYLNLLDMREVVTEIAKGKFTTDKARHSGEGLFFTSRIADKFFIWSHRISWMHHREREDWVFDENVKNDWNGTSVSLILGNNSGVIIKDVFDQYGNPDFNSTVIPVVLMDADGMGLVSRSQAKRLLARLESFDIVFMDFKGVKNVGQAFADEIFRVFKISHPRVRINEINTENSVQDMINRAKNKELAENILDCV